MRSALLFCLALCTASFSVAEERSLRPESCTHVATLQFDDCTVQVIHRCDVTTSTPFWVEHIEDHGLDSIVIRDQAHAERRLIVGGENRINLAYSEATHPRDILAAGAGLRVAIGLHSKSGMKRLIRYNETLRADGNAKEISGHRLDTIIGQVTVEMPSPVGTIKADVVYGYLGEADLLVEIDYRNDLMEHNKALSKLSLLNEEGFEDRTPRFGCDVLSSDTFHRSELPA